MVMPHSLIIDTTGAETDVPPKPSQSFASSITADNDNAGSSNAQYHDLVAEDDDASLLEERKMSEASAAPEPNKNERWLQRPRLLWILFFCLTIFGLVVYWYRYRLRTTQSSEFHPIFGDCGQTPDEARMKGCTYDPLAATWVRPECVYQELIDEFINMVEPVSFYHDKSLSKESRVPIEEIISGQHEHVWASHEFHWIHCAHGVKKVHQALTNHLPIDSYSLDYAHTEHCQLELLETVPHCAEPGSCRPRSVMQKYSSCGYVY